MLNLIVELLRIFFTKAPDMLYYVKCMSSVRNIFVCSEYLRNTTTGYPRRVPLCFALVLLSPSVHIRSALPSLSCLRWGSGNTGRGGLLVEPIGLWMLMRKLIINTRVIFCWGLIPVCFTQKSSNAQISYRITAPMFATSYFVKKFYQKKITCFKTNLHDDLFEMWINLYGCPGIQEQSIFCRCLFFFLLLAVSWTLVSIFSGYQERWFP